MARSRAGGVRLNPSASIMWPAKFEDPLKTREEIKQIQKTPEYERKVNVPVKAALQDASCSMFLVMYELSIKLNTNTKTV